jgi:hypothetical protein
MPCAWRGIGSAFADPSDARTQVPKLPILAAKKSHSTRLFPIDPPLTGAERLTPIGCGIRRECTSRFQSRIPFENSLVPASVLSHFSASRQPDQGHGATPERCSRDKKAASFFCKVPCNSLFPTKGSSLFSRKNYRIFPIRTSCHSTETYRGDLHRKLPEPTSGEFRTIDRRRKCIHNCSRCEHSP